MPKIKPFRGIRPNPALVEQVVLQIENLSLDDARSIRQSNPYSYINMLVPQLDNPYQQGSKRELAFKKINENFEEFLDRKILIRDDRPALYVYRVSQDEIIQTGIWAITSIDDYLNNTIKKHELTRADREKSLIDYLQQTGIDANPVLITYPPVDEINRIIADVTGRPPELNFHKEQANHTIWKVDDDEQLGRLTTAFANLPASYIADGHHRAAAASTLGIERRKLNLKHKGNEEYNFFTSVYMATDQLRILEFHRLLKDLGDLTSEDFLRSLEAHFEVQISSVPVKSACLHEFGMYLEGYWYRLTARPHAWQHNNPVAELDVSILQEYVLGPVLNITDPRTDARLSCVGGIIPIEQIIQQVNNGEYQLAFTLFPTSIEQLIRVADAGEVMPPKSTWFEPKFQAGLVIHQVDY